MFLIISDLFRVETLETLYYYPFTISQELFTYELGTYSILAKIVFLALFGVFITLINILEPGQDPKRTSSIKKDLASNNDGKGNLKLENVSETPSEQIPPLVSREDTERLTGIEKQTSEDITNARLSLASINSMACNIDPETCKNTFSRLFTNCNDANLLIDEHKSLSTNDVLIEQVSKETEDIYTNLREYLSAMEEQFRNASGEMPNEFSNEAFIARIAIEEYNKFTSNQNSDLILHPEFNKATRSLIQDLEISLNEFESREIEIDIKKRILIGLGKIERELGQINNALEQVTTSTDYSFYKFWTYYRLYYKKPLDYSQLPNLSSEQINWAKETRQKFFKMHNNMKDTLAKLKNKIASADGDNLAYYSKIGKSAVDDFKKFKTENKWKELDIFDSSQLLIDDLEKVLQDHNHCADVL